MKAIKNSNLILALGILAAAAFWCIDAAVDAFIFGDEDESLLESIFAPGAHEIYMRGTVLILFLAVSLFARKLLIEQERISKELTHHKTNLEEIVSLRTKQLEKLASTDDLTQIYNRRKFFELSLYEFNRVTRYKHPFSIIMIDIDYFKKINDTYGHQTGDITLQTFSKRVLDSIRETDIFGRLGGEEFGLVLPETTIQDAKELAERIRIMIEKENFPEVGQVTISLGVTQYSPDDKPESIYNRVDTALYSAKETGRNKVVVA